MRCTDFRRRKETRRNVVAQSFQFSDDSLGTENKVPCDILEEARIGAALADNSPNIRPEMPRVARTLALTSARKWLAGIASGKEVDSVGKGACVKRPQIRPKYTVSQDTLCNRIFQNRKAECFPLHVSEPANIPKGKLEPDVEAPTSGAE